MTRPGRLVGAFTAFVAVAYLGYEAFALLTGHETLSRMVYNATQAWGPLPFVVGLVVGGLAVHLWWYWDPRDSMRGGG